MHAEFPTRVVAGNREACFDAAHELLDHHRRRPNHPLVVAGRRVQLLHGQRSVNADNHQGGEMRGDG